MESALSNNHDKKQSPFHRKKGVRFLFRLFLCCLLLVPLSHSGERIIGGFHAKAIRFLHILGGRLSARHDMLLYVSMDGSTPLNLVSGNALLYHHLPSVQGVMGQARRFDDSEESLLQTDVSLGRLPPAGGTLAFWCRPLPQTPSEESRFFWCAKNHAVLGIRLVQKELEVVCSGTNGPNAIRAPFPLDDRFHHVAVTISPDSFCLHLDGKKAACGTLPGGFVAPQHLIYLGENARAFLSADLDDVALWARPLPENEIRRLSRSRFSLPFRYEPIVCSLFHVFDSGCAFFQVFYRVVDRLVPRRSDFAPQRSDIPALEFRMSKNDARHFRNAYEKTLLQGERSRKASRFRKVSIVYGGHSQEAEVCIDELGLFEKAPVRCSFQVKVPAGFLPGGESGVFRLYPLERYPVFHPDARRPLPLSKDHLVRLFVRGDFFGFYQLETLDRQGSAWLLAGKRIPRRSDFLLFDSQPTMTTEEKLLPEKIVERRFREMSALLRSDMRFPWSPQEIKWRKRKHAACRCSMLFAEPTLTAADLKGNNPSAYYVVTNLDLSACGEKVVWTSSQPSVLAQDGSVTRPEGDVPVPVELTGKFPDGTQRAFRFRVMPLTPRLASLHFHFSLPIEKILDRDFTCQWFPAGGASSQWLTGMAGTGGGTHHRGNTSYVRAAKRSMSVEFDQAINAGVTEKPCRHLLLLSGYADSTRLRNKIAFDAFQLMRGPVDRRSAHVSWNEVFVNGEYAGVWEIASRFQDVAGKPFSDLYKVRALNGLWYTTVPDFLTFVGKPPFPADAFADVRDLSKFVIESDHETFLADFDTYFDRDALADFLLLINMTGNVDGRVTNQFLGRRKEDGKWECLPWDYDKTFMICSARKSWLTNPLFERLRVESPAFTETLKSRWAMHRAGPLSDENVLEWIDRQSEFLLPYMNEEFRLLQPIGTEGDFSGQIQVFRSEVLFRLHQLDRRLANEPDRSAIYD